MNTKPKKNGRHVGENRDAVGGIKATCGFRPRRERSLDNYHTVVDAAYRVWLARNGLVTKAFNSW